MGPSHEDHKDHKGSQIEAVLSSVRLDIAFFMYLVLFVVQSFPEGRAAVEFGRVMEA